MEQTLHEMRTLDSSGDSAIKWDKGSPDEVDAARAMFNTLKSKGYVGYLANRKGEKGSQRVDEFDPDAERLIMVPPVKGGYPTPEPTFE